MVCFLRDSSICLLMLHSYLKACPIYLTRIPSSLLYLSGRDTFECNGVKNPNFISKSWRNTPSWCCFFLVCIASRAQCSFQGSHGLVLDPNSQEAYRGFTFSLWERDKWEWHSRADVRFPDFHKEGRAPTISEHPWLSLGLVTTPARFP